MKKLVLVFVFLGFLSTANATLSLVVGDGTTFIDAGNEVTIDIGETVWIGINDDIGVMYRADIGNAVSPLGEWTGNNTVYSPPAISTGLGCIYNTNGLREYWYIHLEDLDTTEIPLPGVGAAAEFHGLAAGDIHIALNPGPSGFDDYFMLHIIPEPATIAFLTFGGLILRLKRIA